VRPHGVSHRIARAMGPRSPAGWRHRRWPARAHPDTLAFTSSPAPPDGRRHGMRSTEGVRMAEQAALGFAALLRQLRAAARLTQEELAEAAGLSPRSVSDLERGVNRTARRGTAELLAGALGL